MLFINCSQAQVTVLPLSDFQQIKLNGTLSLDAIVDSQTMEQTLSQLSTFVSKNCTTDPLVGSSCNYSANGFELGCYSVDFSWMDITGSNFYLRYQNQDITIGEQMSEMQSLFPTAYSRADTHEDIGTGITFKRILLTIGVTASTTTLSFLYDNQTNELKIIRLHDEVG